MKANEIVERFKNVLLSNEVEVEVSEVKEEAAPEVEEQVELSEDVKNIEVEASEEEVDAGYHDKMEEDDDMDMDIEEKFPFYIILPDDMTRMLWDVLMIIVCIYVAMIQPLRIGFADDFWESNVFLTCDV